MRVLLLVPSAPSSGNATSAERIRSHLIAEGHSCLFLQNDELSTQGHIRTFLEANGISAVIGVHLHKVGRLLQGCPVPFGMVFGGTDLNEDIKSAAKLAVMASVVRESRFLVAFTDELKETAERLWADSRTKIHVQPQAVVTNPSKNFDWRDYLHKAGVPLKPHTLLFLLVCGLRRVKDPLFIVHAFSDWHKTHPDVFLLIIGPELDPVLSAEVKNCTANMSGVWFVGPLPQAHLHAAMSSSFCLVNSSISEGMSGAILEAMDLGLPVVARTNAGNASLIRHEETGLLFCTGEVRHTLEHNHHMLQSTSSSSLRTLGCPSPTLSFSESMRQSCLDCI
uniref:glycosyltransferase 1 domain-containing protein 1-like isoform X1 n=3 Tax=Myxine glutinosa TaxID=7769 RepID=UPI00358E70E7